MQSPDPKQLMKDQDWGNGNGQGWATWVLLFIVMGLIFFFWQFGASTYTPISYSTFKEQLADGNVKRIISEGKMLHGQLKHSITETTSPTLTQPAKPAPVTEFETAVPEFGDDKLTDEIVAQKVDFIARSSGGGIWWLLIVNILPFALLVGLGIYFMRRTTQGSGGLMSVGQSHAKLFHKERSSVTFADVAGVKEAKEELQEIITFLKTPAQFTRLGCRVPKGVLLVGPPGTGKTLLARAVAGEAGVPFFSVSGSQFMEMFVGVGAARVRDLFANAKTSAPSIIFVDELDSVGRHRGIGFGGGHDEREQTLNQLLAEIDGFEPSDNVVVIAATNRPDVLDPALLRPGRFDRRVSVDLPSLSERVQILKVHTRKIPLSKDLDLEDIARAMPGRSGADLSNLANEAALTAARNNKDKVGREEFSTARDKILIGQLRGSVVLLGLEKHVVAVHEAGHALVAHLCLEADPVEKVSIIPRGHALGATQQLPAERYNLNIEYLLGRLRVLLGGRASEDLLVGTISTGAADDLGQATHLARRMVAQWGMGETFKHVAFEESNGDVYIGEPFGGRREYSEQTAREIDIEVKNMIDRCYNEALAMLKDNESRLKALSAVLERDETLEGDDLRRMLGPPASVVDDGVPPELVGVIGD